MFGERTAVMVIHMPAYVTACVHEYDIGEEWLTLIAHMLCVRVLHPKVHAPAHDRCLGVAHPNIGEVHAVCAPSSSSGFALRGTLASARRPLCASRSSSHCSRFALYC